MFERMGSVGRSAILIGERPLEDGTLYLAALPGHPSPSELFNAAHAALALPTGPDVTQSLAQHVRRKGARILLAEDNPVNRKVIARMLRYGGHSTAIVNDGEGVRAGADFVWSETARRTPFRKLASGVDFAP